MWLPPPVKKIINALYIFLNRTTSPLITIAVNCNFMYISLRINLDYKYADDDDQYEKLASILAEKYINSHHLKNDEYNVLYMVIEHVGINAIVGVSPKRHQRKREQKERKRPKRERKSIVKRNNKKRKRKSRKR